MDNGASWIGFEVETHEATWVCVKCVGQNLAPNRIDYFMEFEARDPRKEGVPATRKVHLRTGSFSVDCEPGFQEFLEYVVEGQLIETNPWDRFKEVYERDGK